MMALTLWRPWDLLIACGIKTIENRSWEPRGRLQVGDVFVIHAGKTFDPNCIPMAQRLGVPLTVFEGQQVQSAVVAVVRYAGVVTESNDVWFFGPYGWVLKDAVAMQRPVPCKGAMGLWDLPWNVEAEVRSQCKL
jgi:hypothetical protein